MISFNWVFFFPFFLFVCGSFATLLFAEEISGETGGETLFADTRQAYASLSEDVQKKAQQTVLLHSYVYKVL